jgi:hypothetical protein
MKEINELSIRLGKFVDVKLRKKSEEEVERNVISKPTILVVSDLSDLIQLNFQLQ